MSGNLAPFLNFESLIVCMTAWSSSVAAIELDSESSQEPEPEDMAETLLEALPPTASSIASQDRKHNSLREWKQWKKSASQKRTDICKSAAAQPQPVNLRTDDVEQNGTENRKAVPGEL